MTPQLVTEADLPGLDPFGFGNWVLVDRAGQHKRTVARLRPANWLRAATPGIASTAPARPDLHIAVTDPSDEATYARVRTALGRSRAQPA